ncbi:MAG: stalk domain-containing protein [Peptococcaceae bacterium]|nr:stalk domain-containing protein [Peptococcaceae bacterium]
MVVPSTAPVSAATSTTVVFTIGSQTYTVNGQLQTMDAAPFINPDGRTMVPVH